MAIYQSLTLTQVSQNIQQNSSQVRLLWQSTQTGSSYNMIAHEAKYWVSVNGQPEEENIVSYYLPQNTAHPIVDCEITVPHNDKGEATVTVRTWMNTRLSAGVVELSERLTLDSIPRASTVLASDALIGGFSRLAVIKRNSGYSHSIAWHFREQSGYVTESGGISQQEHIFSADSVDFLFPDSFYDAILDAKSDTCTLCISTYAGSELIGQPQTAVFTVSVDESACRPLVGGSVRDINEVTLALTGDAQKMVRFFSRAYCEMTPYAQKGASVVKKQIQGITVEDNSLTVEEFAGENVRFEVTDSRGFTAEHTQQVEQIPYIRLSCDAQAERDDPVSGNATLYIFGDCYAGSFGTVDNEVTVSYSIDGGPPVAVQPSVTEDQRYYASASLTGMDYTRVYSIRVWVSDKLTKTEKQVTLKKGVPVFDWGEGDFAFHVPVQMDSSLNLNGTLTLGGKTLLDMFYPVGAVFTGTVISDPAALFGGSWEQLQTNEEMIYKWKRTG